MTLLDESFYYKGLYKVKVLTKSEGYWIVEAMEDFNDTIDDQKVSVRSGESRIVPISDLLKKKNSSTSQNLPKPKPAEKSRI